MTLCLIIEDERSDDQREKISNHEYAKKRAGKEKYQSAELIILVNELTIGPQHQPVKGRIVKGEAGMAPRDIEMEVIA